MRAFNSTVSIGRINELLIYSPDTGVFTWKTHRNNRVKAGSVAGSTTTFGHCQLRVDFKCVLAHRAAWAIVHGAWPTTDIDHINGDPSDNRIENLRMVSRGENLQNQRKAHGDSTSGALGVRKSGRKWHAKIMKDGVNHNLGAYLTQKDASDAYLSAKRKFHQSCTI